MTRPSVGGREMGFNGKKEVVTVDARLRCHACREHGVNILRLRGFAPARKEQRKKRAAN